MGVKNAHGEPPPNKVEQCFPDDALGGMDLNSPRLDELEKKVVVLEAVVSGLLEAIDLNHVGHAAEERSDQCWSCKVRETLNGLNVARKLMEKTGG